MTDIRYVAPRTLDEAIGAFAAAGSAARILAGGTDLLVQMRSGMVRPGLIVDIKNIDEMTGIEDPPLLSRRRSKGNGAERRRGPTDQLGPINCRI